MCLWRGRKPGPTLGSNLFKVSNQCVAEPRLSDSKAGLCHHVLQPVCFLPTEAVAPPHYPAPVPVGTVACKHSVHGHIGVWVKPSEIARLCRRQPDSVTEVRAPEDRNLTEGGTLTLGFREEKKIDLCGAQLSIKHINLGQSESFHRESV